MRRLFTPFICLTMFAACTVENRNGELQQEFHQPFTYANWKTEQHTTKKGEHVCAITSGYSGIVVYVRSGRNERIVAVQGTRPLTPGAILRVNANGHHYETTQEFFSAQDAPRMAEDFANADKIYLEWTEKLGRNPSFARYTSIVRGDGFRQQFGQCP